MNDIRTLHYAEALAPIVTTEYAQVNLLETAAGALALGAANHQVLGRWWTPWESVLLIYNPKGVKLGHHKADLCAGRTQSLQITNDTLLLLLSRKTISQIHFTNNSNQNIYCCVPQMKLGHAGSDGEVRAPTLLLRSAKTLRDLGKAAFQMSVTTAKLLSHNILPYSAGLQETQLKNTEWRRGLLSPHTFSSNAYLKISSSRDKHFAVGREAKVGHPASMGSSSFLYWNWSTQMKKLAIWDIPYLDR